MTTAAAATATTATPTTRPGFRRGREFCIPIGKVAKRSRDRRRADGRRVGAFNVNELGLGGQRLGDGILGTQSSRHVMHVPPRGCRALHALRRRTPIIPTYSC